MTNHHQGPGPRRHFLPTLANQQGELRHLLEVALLCSASFKGRRCTWASNHLASSDKAQGSNSISVPIMSANPRLEMHVNCD